MAMEIRIVRSPITLAELKSLAAAQFGEMIKAAVDVERKLLALGGELHSDEESMLLEDGSKQEHLWGINLYPNMAESDRIEFDSMINVRPGQNNRSRGVEDPRIRERIVEVVRQWIKD